MIGYMDPSNWRYNRRYANSEAGEYTTNGLRPDLIIVWERRPYRVLEVTPRPFVNWKPEYIKGWEESDRPDPDTWRYRPFALVLAPEFATDTKRQHLEAPGDYRWTTLPEHFSVCRLCQELVPCRHVVDEAVVDSAVKQMQDAMKILPGACHHCKELIRPRQGSMRFEGANLIRPDMADNSVVFHTRSAGGCWSAAFDYDKRWVAAKPGRRGKLSCEGSVTVHLDGSLTCSLGDACAGETDVLGEAMRHTGGETRHHRAWVGRDGRTRPASACWCAASTKEIIGTLDTEIAALEAKIAGEEGHPGEC